MSKNRNKQKQMVTVLAGVMAALLLISLVAGFLRF